MRKEWINEGKPTERSRSADRSPDGQQKRRPHSQPSSGEPTAAKPATTAESPAFAEDAIQESPAATKSNGTQGSSRNDGRPVENLFISDDEDEGNQPPEDDLDALLAEEQRTPMTSSSRMPPGTDTWRREDNFDDDMEAMADMDDLW